MKSKTVDDLSKSTHATEEGPVCFIGPYSKLWCLVSILKATEKETLFDYSY